MRCWFSLACVTDNAIGDAGVSVIAHASLRADNRVSTDGMVAFADAVGVNFIKHVVELTETSILISSAS